MRRLILIGRSGAGKTSLCQALRGEAVKPQKTQSVERADWLIDTPGEYAENLSLGSALALFSYEADVVGLLLSATEPYSLYPPGITAQANREVIGIVTQIDAPDARPERADAWLRLAGCRNVFHLSAKTGEGLCVLREFLATPHEGIKPTHNRD